MNKVIKWKPVPCFWSYKQNRVNQQRGLLHAYSIQQNLTAWTLEKCLAAAAAPAAAASSSPEAAAVVAEQNHESHDATAAMKPEALESIFLPSISDEPTTTTCVNQRNSDLISFASRLARSCVLLYILTTHVYICTIWRWTRSCGCKRVYIAVASIYKRVMCS